jgi:hypothetical protein
MFEWVLGLWRRDISTLGLWDVLRGHGLRGAASHDPQALAKAVERCTRCRDSIGCSRLLQAGQLDELAEFCPNAMYVAHLQAMKRHAPKRDLL